MYLLGGHKVAVLDDCRFWAERGLIHCEDGRNNSYKTISVRDFLERIQALNEMLGKSTDQGALYDRRQYLQGFVGDAVEVVRRAREQGMPTDPTFHPQKPCRVVVPQGVPSF
jgi:hypothetical protein